MSQKDNTSPIVASFEQVKDNLPGAWLSDVRRGAIRSFETQGFPTPRTEAWKYTNLNRLTRSGFDPSAEIAKPDTAAWSGLLVEGASRIVILNGRYDEDASDIGPQPDGVSVTPLSAAVDDTDPELEGQLATIAPTDGAPLVALNTAFMRDGVVLKLADGVQLERPLQVLHIVDAGETALAVHPRTLIVAGDNSAATIIETFAGAADTAYWTNAVTEIKVGRNASVSHVKRQTESVEAYHTALTQVRLGRDARYRSVALATGAALSRNETRVAFEGEGAEASLAGGALLRGRQHADNTTEADHTVPHTNSNQVFRNVLDDASHSVFQGGVIVRQDAQKTDSSQSNRNLLLSDGAQADTKPELQIFADDVKCAHGATVGDLDKAALFYLQSRGIPTDQAKSLLIEAFIAEIFDDLPEGPVGDHIADGVSIWMEDAA
ncbi:MAG: Fe-S cluster assembly protein SufD [Alphaproteobacteria bacterium]